VADQADWPEWWQWELDLTDHLVERMVQRGLTETDLRAMLAGASTLVAGRRPDRWRIQTRWHRRLWEVVVEPDIEEEVLVVVTAYEVS